MTTFHDPQPQSRRAARRNERGETAENGFERSPSVEGSSAPGFSFDSAAARELWEIPARQASHSSPVPPVSVPPASELPATEAPASGRRAAPPPSAAEPLTYATQSRSPQPAYDPPTFQAAPSGMPVPLASAEPQHRVRDYSPHGRRAAPAAPAAQAPAAAPAGETEHRAETRVPIPPATVQQPFAKASEKTLSRRELRAMHEAETHAPLTTQTTHEAPVAYEQPVAYEAPVAYEQPTAYEQPAALETPAPVVQPSAPVVDQLSAFEALFQPAPAPQALPPVAPQPQADTGLTAALAEYDTLSRSPQVAEAQPTRVEPTPSTPPSGHWAAQLEAADDPFESILGRSVGSGHTETNALVLPGMPSGIDIRGPLTSTGEVMLTGSIDLPRSLSSTGTTAAIERDGIDALFDINDTEINATDSSPVRAIRAVSTYDSGSGASHTQKPKGAKALKVLLIAASGLAVVVAGLLIAAVALNAI